MNPRQAFVACALAFVGCGGLAADGEPLAEQAEPCPLGSGCAPAATDGDRESRRLTSGETLGAGAEANRASPPGPAVAPGRIGAACEAPSDEGSGELVLAESEACGMGNLCLTRATASQAACPTGLDADGTCPGERVLPIPPSLAPTVPGDRVCTCRCDGFDPGERYCSCPLGMTCRELIRTLGTNGEARAYAGSYCLY